jgi:hypothetical protein
LVAQFLPSLWRWLTGRSEAGSSADRTAAVVLPEVDDPTTSAADAAEAPGGDALFDSPQEVIDELDTALFAAFDPARQDVPPAGTDATGIHGEQDDRAAQELFASIAAYYSKPVKDFIVELERGTATKEWIEICQPVMGSIIDGADSLGLHEVSQRMSDFRDALALAQTTDGPVFDDDCREFILSSYEELVGLLPETFAVDERDDHRESIIIHSLLRQVPGVGHVTFEKLYGAGLTSLDALFLANPTDLAAVSGVPRALCERICDKIREHQDRLRGTPSSLDTDRCTRLSGLLHDLHRHHARFQQIAAEDDPELAAEKRESLRLRQTCLLQINVLLAEMGAVDLVEETKKLGVEKRIERLVAFLRARVGDRLQAADTGAGEAHSMATHP